jgi:ATP-dependent DNA ligase
MKKIKLYKKTYSGKIRVWMIEEVEANDGYIISFGEENGNIQQHLYSAKPPKLALEIDRKVKLKLNEGYRKDRNSLDKILLDENDLRKPMLAYPYQKVKEIQFPMIIQPKLNGVRGLVRWEKRTIGEGLFAKTIEETTIRSREGKLYYIPHIKELFDQFYNEHPDKRGLVFDGELYIHGEPLNRIKSRAALVDVNDNPHKTSYPTEDLEYWVYDLAIENVVQSERLDILKSIYLFRYLGSPIKFVFNIGVISIEEARLEANKFIELGYEGGILRNPEAEYKFSKRSKALLKIKKIQHTECEILDIIDKGEKAGRANIVFLLKNDINSETFECTPGFTNPITKKATWSNEDKLAAYNNKSDLIGKKATVRFYERSGVAKVPFHANVETIRDYE